MSRHRQRPKMVEGDGGREEEMAHKSARCCLHGLSTLCYIVVAWFEFLSKMVLEVEGWLKGNGRKGGK